MKNGSKGEGSRAGRDARETEFLWTAEKEVRFVTGLFMVHENTIGLVVVLLLVVLNEDSRYTLVKRSRSRGKGS